MSLINDTVCIGLYPICTVPVAEPSRAYDVRGGRPLEDGGEGRAGIGGGHGHREDHVVRVQPGEPVLHVGLVFGSLFPGLGSILDTQR